MRCALLLAAAALACAACDDSENIDGARGPCASGGALAGCPDSAKTPEDACWRLVECGSYPLDAVEENQLDWGVCVDTLERLRADRAAIVIACIAASTCDELQAPGSPAPFAHTRCFDYGDE